MDHSNYWRRHTISRRNVLRAGGLAATGLAGAALLGCGSDDDPEPGTTGTQSGTGTATSATGSPAGGGGAAASNLIPAGLGDVYPRIADFHWSRQVRSEGPPKSGGRLQLPLVYDTPSWDTHDPSITLNNVPMNMFYSRLIRPDLTLDSAFAGGNNLWNLNKVGDLAESWEIPDEQTYVFHIRQNVKWHNLPPVDGRQLTSEDIRYSFQSYVDDNSVGQAAIFRDVDSFETPDEFTFTIHTTKPVAYLLNSLTGPLTFVTAPEAMERPNGTEPGPPIGTGPFVMRRYDFRVKLEADRNPDYFLEGRPYLDGIDLTTLADSSALIAAFRTGQIQHLHFQGPQAFEDLLASEGWAPDGGRFNIVVQQQNPGGSPAMFWRVDREPYNDVRVRRALSMAIDRDVLLEGVFGVGNWALGFPTDWIQPADKPWPRESSEFGPYFQYDPDEATSLLSAAGAEGMTVDILIGSPTGQATGTTADQIQLVQEFWRTLGVNANIRVLDTVAQRSAFYGRTTAPNEIIGGGSISAGVDLDDFSYRVMRSGEVANYSNIADPELDRLLDAQQAEFDVEQRREIGRQIADYDLEQVYRFWMTVQYWWEMKDPRVQNFQAHDVYMFSNGWGLDQVVDTWLDA